jgi:hypothetical protein
MTTGSGVSPEFLALIVSAGTETVRVQLPSKALAIKMRHRVHSARKQLFREADKPTASMLARGYAEIASQVETSIEEVDGGTWVLIVRPKDSEFKNAIKNAGVVIEEATPPDPNRPATHTSVPTPDVLEQYLKPKEDER